MGISAGWYGPRWDGGHVLESMGKKMRRENELQKNYSRKGRRRGNGEEGGRRVFMCGRRTWSAWPLANQRLALPTHGTLLGLRSHPDLSTDELFCSFSRCTHEINDINADIVLSTCGNTCRCSLCRLDAAVYVMTCIGGIRRLLALSM